MLTPSPPPSSTAGTTPNPTTPRARRQARAAWWRGWAAGWHLPDRLSVWAWADQHRILPKETSKEPGPWRTDRNPPARGIMESLSPHSGAEIVTVVAGVQTVKTESLNNLVGYIIDHDPGPLIVCQPTQELGNAWKLMRFDPLIDTIPSLKRRIRTTKRRESANTLGRVKFPGGWLIISHAASASSLGMYSARYVLADEVDSYEELKGGEGDPLMTLRRRADSFGRLRKIYQCSSPKKILGASLIWREYLSGDQREYHVPCPHCGQHQVLEMEGILPSGEYLCQHCGVPIPHGHKTDLLAAGRWIARHPDRIAHHSYRLSSLYTPLGLGRTWAELYAERAAAGDDPALIKAFVSTSLAIPYEPPGGITATDLERSVETWPMRQPPAACLITVAATDVQANRLETLILGFGRGPSPKHPQLYVVDYHVTHGNPVSPETYADLADYLEQPVLNPYGIDIRPRLHAIDSGNWTAEVYAACHLYAVAGWVPVKGSSGRHAALISPPKPHDINWRGSWLKKGGSHHLIGTDTAKDTLLDRLAITPTQASAERWWHLPSDLPATWFSGIAAERRDPESGRWEKTASSARNEPIDTAVYAWALAHLTHSPRLPRASRLAIGTWSSREWDQLTARLCPTQGDLFQPAPFVAAVSQVAATAATSGAATGTGTATVSGSVVAPDPPRATATTVVNTAAPAPVSTVPPALAPGAAATPSVAITTTAADDPTAAAAPAADPAPATAATPATAPPAPTVGPRQAPKTTPPALVIPLPKPAPQRPARRSAGFAPDDWLL